ncbi:TrbG/VirB9 family P-type conjugative transfer protein [Pelagibius sp. Alg239-R121]|uniref:TrbG/VirB9 family P-type conjugative transfer protein n=1 Tax=Pelagibius sp. Alg239-R121 TaxID=2993448 RepID=UPI0024A6307C|nr:TrbG/VirB9 family P-type conjugative transfer protein [Pelagibius sp. Alg239-R121]
MIKSFRNSALAVVCLAAAYPAHATLEPVSSDGHTAVASECRYIVVLPGQRFSAPINLKIGTRLRFLKPVRLVTVSLKNWEKEQDGPSVWIRPTTTAEPTDHVGVTVMLEGNGEQNEFDFVFKATNDKVASCTFIADAASAARIFEGDQNKGDQDTAFLQRQLNAAIADAEAAKQQANARAAAAVAQTTNASDAYSQSMKEMHRQFSAQAEDALWALRRSINTSYDWHSGKESRPRIIDGVYDDGRSTFIRITESGFGIPAVTAKAGENFYVVQYDYHDLTGVYEVQGLFDHMVLRFGTQEITIQRRN